MLRIKTALLAIVCVVFLSSCSAMRYTTRTGFKKYSREVPVAITTIHDHTRTGSGELVRQLLANGYDVITIDNVRHDGRDRLFKDRRIKDATYNSESIYILEIQSTPSQNNRNQYEAFHATLSDGNTGRIMLVADLTEPRGVRATIKALIRKMNTFIK